MPPEKSQTLKKILGSLGLHDMVKELSATVECQTSPSSSTAPATGSSDGFALSLSPRESVSATVGGISRSSMGHVDPGEDGNFGSDLQILASLLQTSDSLPSLNPIGNASDDRPRSQSNLGLAAYDSYGKDFSQRNSSDESLVDELSYRVGILAIGPDGRTKLRGPASILNVEPTHAQGQPGGPLTPSKRGAHSPTGSRDSSKVPEDLQEHLIRLYFAWENPFADYVDQEIYNFAKAQSWLGKDTTYFSQALSNALCAVGAAFEARYHPAFVTFPKSLVEYFVDRARRHLEAELDYPSIATLQAIAVLACHEVGNGNKGRGWLYSGMSVRLAFDLALHLDMSTNVVLNQITAHEADMRRNLFWAICTADQLLGFQLGRPVRISMEDVTVGRPKIPDTENSNNTSPNVTSRNTDPQTWDEFSIAQNVRNQRVVLCNIMATCGYLLYETSKYSKDALQKLNAGIVAQLQDWQAKLHVSLQIELDTSSQRPNPAVILLQMHYHQSIIYAHRPWMSKHGLQPQPPRGPGYRHARGMCVQSAIAIAKILILYESYHRTRRIHHSAVHVTFSAAILLLFADVCRFPDWEQQNIRACLSTCFRSLQEFASSWQSAKQAIEVIQEMQHRWRDRHVSNAEALSTIPTGRTHNDLYQTDSSTPDINSTDGSMWAQEQDMIQNGALFDPEIDWSTLPDCLSAFPEDPNYFEPGDLQFDLL